MRICITLDDVIRAKTKQAAKIYKKYINKNVDLDSLDYSSGDYQEIFNFDTMRQTNKFMYDDYAFEIFAEADVVEKGIDTKLNLWQISNNENDELNEPIELIIGNTKEYNASIGFTYFFISKIATRAREVFLPKESEKLWDVCDVLVTADKSLLKTKPDNKISIKIDREYNKDIDSDYTYDNLSSFLDDEEIIAKLINKENKIME